MSTEHQWQLAGNAAERYERVLVPVIFRPWAEDLVKLADLRGGERVLDVACGTGIVARLAAQHVGATGDVTGLDLNVGMIAVARSLPSAPGAGITWIESSALDMRLADASFDVVLCQQGFQFFPDKSAALAEMKRVLSPGGRLFLSVWAGATPYANAMWGAVERHVGADAAATLRSSRTVPGSETLRRHMVKAGFRDVQVRSRTLTTRLPAVEDYVLQHLSASPVADAVARLSDGDRAALGAEVGAALREYRDGDGVAFAEEANVAIAFH
jgi:ubiquinone/menaquinone biosynthesis C-methylase UbiE